MQCAAIFGDHMVLQAQEPLSIWGSGDPGEVITIEFYGRHVTDIVGNDGTWHMELGSFPYGRNLQMQISGHSNTICLEDVAVGEVWIAGGQSNMEYFLRHDLDQEQVYAGPHSPDICFWDMAKISYPEQIQEHDYSAFCRWRRCTAEDLPWFSAVGYYFAEELQKVLDVPIGIVGCNWGGTPACAWLDTERLRHTAGAVWLEDYQKATSGMDLNAYQKWFKEDPRNDRSDPFRFGEELVYPGLNREEQLARMDEVFQLPMGPWHERRPGGLYESMLQQIAPYGARGVIWYQGESDEGHPDVYGTVLQTVIESWRSLWKKELPFLFVQLAPFSAWMDCVGDRYPILRKQQQWVAQTTSKAYLASNGDLGMEYDIHPKHKRPVGQRLALLARKYVYEQPVCADAPTYCRGTLTETELILEFDGSPLQAPQGPLTALQVRDAYESEIVFAVSVQGRQLILRGQFPQRVKVSFAQTPFYTINLYDIHGLPAFPFKAELTMTVPTEQIRIRDPFVHVDYRSGTYHLYGTTDDDPWQGRGQGFLTYTSTDLTQWQGPFTAFAPPEGFWGRENFWAPEVWQYGNEYIMLATFHRPGCHRGVQVLRAQSLDQPFVPVKNGPITPDGWDCLDGTFYMAPDGTPWLVFSHEWSQIDDGAICAAPMTKDLMKLAATPQVLFTASEAPWTVSMAQVQGINGVYGTERQYVTDGPFVYRDADGSLRMLWSSFSAAGYAVGCAVSASGAITGPWHQETHLIHDQNGGHAMRFTALDGTIYLALHSPNETPLERPSFLRLG